MRRERKTNPESRDSVQLLSVSRMKSTIESSCMRNCIERLELARRAAGALLRQPPLRQFRARAELLVARCLGASRHRPRGVLVTTSLSLTGLCYRMG